MIRRALLAIGLVVVLSGCMGATPQPEEEQRTRTSVGSDFTDEAVDYVELFRFSLDFPDGPSDPAPAPVDFAVPSNATDLRMDVLFVSDLPVVSLGSHWLILLQEPPSVVATWKEGGEAGRATTGYLCCGGSSTVRTDFLPRDDGNLTFDTRGWGYLRAEAILSKAQGQA